MRSFNYSTMSIPNNLQLFDSSQSYIKKSIRGVEDFEIPLLVEVIQKLTSDFKKRYIGILGIPVRKD